MNVFALLLILQAVPIGLCLYAVLTNRKTRRRLDQARQDQPTPSPTGFYLGATDPTLNPPINPEHEWVLEAERALRPLDLGCTCETTEIEDGSLCETPRTTTVITNPDSGCPTHWPRAQRTRP